jgi:hypothetical protein
MIIHRTNTRANGRAVTAEDRLAVMQRHHESGKAAGRAKLSANTVAPPLLPSGGQGGYGSSGSGDIIYGAKAIARFLFGEDDNRARRRVFCLWAHYRDRDEPAGFIKLKGAVCLSKSQWRGFHGLG